MKCPYCQSDVLEGAVVCTHCNRDFAVLANVLRGVEHSRHAAQSEIAELKAEVASVTDRLAEAEARLPRTLVPFSSRRPLALAALTSAAVAVTSAVSWEIEGTPVSEPLLLISFALAPIVAGLTGALRGIGTRKLSLLLGVGAALAILLVQWSYSGFGILKSWPAVAVLLATPAARVTGRIVNDMTKGSRPTTATDTESEPLDPSDPTKVAMAAAEHAARSWPALKPLMTAVVALVPVVAGFLGEDKVQAVKAEEVQLDETAKEKEADAQIYVTTAPPPTTTTTEPPRTTSTSTDSSGPGPSRPPSSAPPSSAPPELPPEPEPDMLTLDEVVGRRLLEDELLSPLQFAADAGDQASGGEDNFLKLTVSDEFQQKLRTLQAMDLLTFIDDDYSTVEVSPWGEQVLASVSGQEVVGGLELIATDGDLTVGESVTVSDSARFPVYLGLEVGDDDSDDAANVVIDTALTTDDGDAVLRLYTFDERFFIGRDDDGGPDFNARLVLCTLPSGRYLIEVDRFSDVGGFEVAVADASDDEACSAT